MEWCKWVPTKVNIHSWRMEMGKIATGVALKNRNVQLGEPLCPLCGSDDESVDHLFIACQAASVIWNGISSWCKIPNIFAFSIKDLLGIYKEIRASESKKEAVQGIILIACWSLWRARNNLMFSHIEIRIDRILSEVKALGFLWFSSRSRHKGIDWAAWSFFVNM
ncbi:putative reverse transcriptase zinc-binding domain-containing protein [Helianthus annuus]|nr:putative reverse transcriptase zinc-binding domain-containing protein [Helianthus annuus]